MKKAKMFFWVGLGNMIWGTLVLFISPAFGDTAGPVIMMLGMLHVCAGVPFFIVGLVKRKHLRAPTVVTAPAVESAPAVPAALEWDWTRSSTPADINEDQVLVYQYDLPLIILRDAWDSLQEFPFCELTFKAEPDNEIDPNTVCVYLNDTKLAYLPNDTHRQMILDYQQKKQYFVGIIRRYSLARRAVEYRLSFYKPLEWMESKSFNIVKTSKIAVFTGEKRSDKLMYMSEGDMVTVEPSDDEESYVIYDEMYDEIGELPASAHEFIESKFHKKIVGVIENIETDYENVKASVIIYLVK